MDTGKYEAVIGLEVHAQLLTDSKLFSADSTAFGSAANTHTSAISLAHPGTLPRLNEKVLLLAVKLGVALDCEIQQQNYFARKHYFYPDLPKGYQVSQHSLPVCLKGAMPVTVKGVKTNIRLNRIHMEEDAGKSIHDLDDKNTCVDLNRAGTPLLEIVTEPDLRSPDELYNWLTDLRKLLRWLDVCDGNMEEGSLRCDANISVRLKGETKLGTRVEVKNLNSIRNAKRAAEIEIARLISITEKGETIQQETRSYDADSNSTFALRSKEDAEDYRYLPEPDLPPVYISNALIESVKSSMPEMPSALKDRLTADFNLTEYDAQLLLAERDDVTLFDQLVAKNISAKIAVNWITGPVRNYCREHSVRTADFPLKTDTLEKLISITTAGKIHFNVASVHLLHALLKTPDADPQTLAETLGLLSERDETGMNKWIEEVLQRMPEKVKEYKSGKKALLGLFAGEVKKLSKGKADMSAVNKLLLEKLN